MRSSGNNSKHSFRHFWRKKSCIWMTCNQHRSKSNVICTVGSADNLIIRTWLKPHRCSLQFEGGHALNASLVQEPEGQGVINNFLTFSNSWHGETGMDGLPQKLDNVEGCLQT